MDKKKLKIKDLEQISNSRNSNSVIGNNPLQDGTTSIAELKKRFANGELPTQDDFAAIFDSYFHKDIKIPEEDIDGLINDLNSKEDKTDADQKFENVNQLLADLLVNKETVTDAEAKYKDLDSRKEDKADANKRFGAVNDLMADLLVNKETVTDAEAKYKDLDGRKEDKAEADKRFGAVNDLMADLMVNKEDKTEADKQFSDLNTKVKALQDGKEDKADMVNYLQISPDGLQDNDIAIREGGKWVRKQASEVSTIKTLTLQQNGETLGAFDGKEDKTVNMDAPKTDGTGAKGAWNIDITGKADISKLHYLNNTNNNFVWNKKNVVSSSNAPVSGADFHFKGIIKIKLPVGWSSSMLSLDIDLYNYHYEETGYSKICLGGYNFKGDIASQQKPFWTNCSANIVGYTYRVRFGYDGTKCCILLGDLSTVWNYPSLIVKDLQIGYTDRLLDGDWAIEYITTEDGITNIAEPVVNDNMSVNYAKMFGPFTAALRNQDIWGQLTTSNGYDNWNFATDKQNEAFCIGEREKKTSMQIDGYFYQDEGSSRVVDENSIFRFTGNTLTITVNGTAVGSYNGASNQTINIPASPGYVHLANEVGGHSADNITTTPNNRFCSDSEKTKWNTSYVPITGNTTINGTLSATGGFFEQSDASIKSNVQNIDLSAAKDLHLVEFDRIDTNRHGYGVIAQEVEKLYPTVVTTDEQSGIKQVNYNEVYAIKLAYLEQELSELRKEIKQLKQSKN